MPGTDLDDYIRDCDFPCSRDDLLAEATAQKAPGEVIHNLNMLPDKEFEDVESVSKAVAVAVAAYPTGQSPD